MLFTMVLNRYPVQYVRKHRSMSFGEKYTATEKFTELRVIGAERLSMGGQRNTQLCGGTSWFCKHFVPTEKGERENDF